MSQNEVDSPGVRVPPPLIFVAALAIGWLLSRWAPTPFMSFVTSKELGGVLMVIGVLLALSAVYTFHQARTNLRPDRPSRALVLSGPYRFTRNPMYLSLTVVYLGVSVLMQSLWSLMLLPLVLFFIRSKVISREEQYLERRFGDEYSRYKSQVRRWI